MPHVELKTLQIDALPPAEDDVFEYKSSLTPLPKLQEKIIRAASAFANSGGGCFIAGVDGEGIPDGGLAPVVQRQSLRDWVDQAVAKVSPPVRYEIALVTEVRNRGRLEEGHVILVVSFFPSEAAPHMANDNRYYIRAGAHSVPSPHFITESLWARRGLAMPRLTHAIRQKPADSNIVQIGVVALNSVPAIDVEFSISPVVGPIKEHFEEAMPLLIPVVDMQTPFFVDIAIFGSVDKYFTDESAVTLKYQDLAGNHYDYRSQYSLKRSMLPLQIGSDYMERLARAADIVAKKFV